MSSDQSSFIPQERDENAKKIFMLSVTKDQKVLGTLIRSLGGKVSRAIYPSEDREVTHVVCFKPDENLLGSIAEGTWVLHVNYIYDSKKNDAFLDEENYEFGNPLSEGNIPQPTSEIEKKLADAAYKWRPKLQETPKEGAFKDMNALLSVLPDKHVAQDYVPKWSLTEFFGKIN